MRSSQGSLGVPNQHEQPVVPLDQPPPPGADNNEPNIYETIDKRVKNNRRREAELHRASTISTGTKYESIDRRTLPTRSYTATAESHPISNSVSEEKPFDQDVSDPYIIGKTLERQNKPIVTDIYADSITNRESFNQGLTNRDSVNLEMFTPATDVVNWQAPEDGPSDQADKNISSPSTTSGRPEDMLTLID